MEKAERSFLLEKIESPKLSANPKIEKKNDEQTVRYQTGGRDNTYGNITPPASSPTESASECAFSWNHLGAHIDTSGNNVNSTYVDHVTQHVDYNYSTRILHSPPYHGQ